MEGLIVTVHSRGAATPEYHRVQRFPVRIGRSFIETTSTSIPFHRILKICYDGEVLFDRARL